MKASAVLPPTVKVGAPVVKYVGVFLMAVLGLGILWLMVRKIVDKITAPPESSSDFEYDPAKLTFNENAYIQMAEDMHTSMDGGGTDEDSVFNVLEELQNSHDWAKLVKVYGRRELCNNRTFIDFGCQKLNLVQSLKLEFFGNWNGTIASFFAAGVVGAYVNQRDQKRLQEELSRLGFQDS